MRLSQLFTKTLREAPSDEVSVNAQYLIRGGFVFKNSAGVYSFLPLGWRVMNKISNIVREEMNAIGGQELFMPALVEKKYMEPTARWDLGVGYKVFDQEMVKQAQNKNFSGDPSFSLGWSHEEVLTAISAKYINSYKDLPFAAYQIQTKFRNEARAKSGLLRGREFMMKDLYSFHTSERDLEEYYQKVKDAYFKVFERCGLRVVYTVAAGGAFTISNTHEFQALADVGEDAILMCLKCDYAENVEISELKNADACPKCGGNVAEKKAIEVGNIFPLGTKYSAALGLEYSDENGIKQPVVMGSYGIGISRLMATVVEVSNDGKGIVWPENIAPFKFHLISLDSHDSEIKNKADQIYNDLTAVGAEVLYDNIDDKTAGEKFADADLIGCPIRIVVSKKTLDKGSVEIKKRTEKEVELVSIDKLTELSVRGL